MNDIARYIGYFAIIALVLAAALYGAAYWLFKYYLIF